MGSNTFAYTCHKCGRREHYIAECPKLECAPVRESYEHTKAVSREGKTKLLVNLPAYIKAERGNEPSSVVKDKSSETIRQVEIQDAIDSDMESEIDCTDEDSELDVNETEVRSEAEDRNLKNIEELREQQTEVVQPS